MMQGLVRFLAFVALVAGGTLGFQIPVASRGSLTSRSSSNIIARASAVPGTFRACNARASRSQRRSRPSLFSMQFGEQDKMPTFDEEQERDFFKSELDSVSNKEKLRDPIVLITIGWIVGIAVVAVGFVLYGVN